MTLRLTVFMNYNKSINADILFADAPEDNSPSFPLCAADYELIIQAAGMVPPLLGS